MYWLCSNLTYGICFHKLSRAAITYKRGLLLFSIFYYMTLKNYFTAINKDNKVFAVSRTFPSGYTRSNLTFQIEGDKFVIYCSDYGGPYKFNANQQVELLHKNSVMVVSEEDNFNIKLSFISAAVIPHPPEIY